MFSLPGYSKGRVRLWSQRIRKPFVFALYTYIAVDLHFETSPPLRPFYENIGFFYRFSVDEKPKRIKGRRFQTIMH